MRKTPFLLIGLLLVSTLAVNLISPITADEPRGTRNPGAGIEITVPANDTGKPTDIVTYDFTVKNVGDIVDNFTFTVYSDRGWDVNLSSDTAGPLDINETVTVSVNITIPMGMAAGTVEILNFWATSATETFIEERVAVNITVEAAFILSIDIDGGYARTKGIDPPDVANYTLTIRNKGNVNVTITLRHSTPTGGWQAEFPKYPNGLVAIYEANETQAGTEYVNLTVTAPPAAQPDAQITIIVWADKTDSPTWSSRDHQEDITITTIVSSNLGVVFNWEQLEGRVDFTATLFNFTMTNSGNKDLQIDLIMDNNPLLIAWLDLEQLIVRVGEVAVHNTLRVRTAANTKLGNYSINITATEHATGDYINSTTFYFIVVPRLNVTKISISEDEPLQLKEITLTALIENIGYVDARNITVKFYDGKSKIGEKDIDRINTSQSTEAKIKWSPSDFGNRTVWVKIDVEGEGGDGSFDSHGTDIVEHSVHVEVEINWEPYYFIIFVIIVIILGVAVVTSLFDLKYYSGVPTGAGYDDYGEEYGDDELPPDGYPDEEGPEPKIGEEEERGPVPFGTEGFGDERKEPFSYEREEKEMFRPPPKTEPAPRERHPPPVPAETREPRAPLRDHELKDEISKVKDKLYKTKSLGIDTANIDNLLSMANRSLDAGDTDKTKQYLKYANERIDGLMAKREEAVQAIREAKEVLSGMRDSSDMTIVENFVVKADSLFEEGDFREAINYANKAKDRALRLQRREMRL
jgi:uncharacterized membrane protein